MVHHTKDKGDLATVKAIADLTMKGFVVFTPVVCEHLPFDLIGYRDGKMLRFQSKFRTNGDVSKKTTWNDKNGSHTKHYDSNDFDYYALYLPEKDVVCYPSISFKGARISSEIPNSATPFYWYEDFLNLTDQAKKKTYRDFGIELKREGSSDPRPNMRKTIRPSKEELEKLIWSTPMQTIGKMFNVSGTAIAKWAKTYNIQVPGRGYWNKKIGV